MIHTKRPHTDEQGMAAVELAVIMAFFLLPLIAGIVTYGKYMNVQHSLSRAALQASIEASRDGNPQSVAEQYLVSAGLTAQNVSVEVSTNGQQPVLGTMMTVTINYMLDTNFWLGLESYVPTLSMLSASATTRHM